MSAEGEFAEDIKAHAAAHGFEVTDSKLKYWREQGAIGWLGSTEHPSGSGRTGLYPPDTSRLVVAFCRLLHEKHDLAGAMWRLWILGYPVASKWTQDRIVADAAHVDALRERVRRGAFNETETAFSDTALDELEKPGRFYNGIIRRTRKLVSVKLFPSFLFNIVRLALGHKLPVQARHAIADKQLDAGIAEEHETVIAGLGVERMTLDRVPGVTPPSPHDQIGVLNVIARRMREPVLHRIKRLSIEELKLAAQEVAAVQSNNQHVFRALSWVVGKHAFGRGHAARTFEEYSGDDNVRLTMLWALVRPEFREGVAVEMKIHQDGSAAALADLSDQLQDRINSDPQLAATWTPKFLRKVLKSRARR